MDFAFTPEQELLRESARGLLARECPPALLRAHIKDLSAADPLWDHLKEFSELGTGPTVDLCVFMEELGFVAAPGPFFASAVLGAPLLDAVGSDLLPKVLSGAQTVTVAIAGADGQWVMNGENGKTFVPEAATVDRVVAVAGDGTVVLLDHPPTRRVETIDTTRPVYDVDTSGGGSSIGRIDRATLDAVLAHATVALAAEMVGTARRLLAMTLQYAKDRHQFGVPIGSFQAVQHKLADMSLDVERAWSAVYYAAMTVEVGDDDRHRAVHVAKAAAGEAAKRAAKDGIQIHGGIGYTWEHDLHLFMRRAFASEALLGTTGWHHDRLADLLIG
jgi:alkylation response protein AidB-like acyl-CoA dehydrogenase